MTPNPLTSRLTNEVLERIETQAFRQLHADIAPPREPKYWDAWRDGIVAALGPLAKDLAFHADCRPNRQQAEAWREALEAVHAEFFTSSRTPVESWHKIEAIVRAALESPASSPEPRLDMTHDWQRCDFPGRIFTFQCQRCMILSHESGADTGCVLGAGHLPAEAADAAAAAPLVSPPGETGLGLSIDMTDADRLRQWADKIDTIGHDISAWGSPTFVSHKLLDIATRLEQTVRDVGVLRAAPPGERTPPTCATCRFWWHSPADDEVKQGARDIGLSVNDRCEHPSENHPLHNCDAPATFGCNFHEPITEQLHEPAPRSEP